MKGFELSRKLKKLPPYLFAAIDRKKNQLRARGIRLIDLSIGDPDIVTPGAVVSALYTQAKIKSNQQYALDAGKLSLRGAIKRWMKKRFSVNLSEYDEILPLIGSKEGLVHFPLAFVNRGEYILIPSPAYPAYQSAAILAGANIYEVPLLEKNDFLPELDKIPLRIRNKTALLYLNYPNNPTTVFAPRKFLGKLVKFCSKYGIIIAYDNAYSEIYFDRKPLSILQVPGAKEIALEFHSLSKTFCMTGFRIGWACGNKSLIQGLLKLKTNIDSGIFGAIQDAGAYALEKQTAYIAHIREVIKQRRDVFVAGLKNKGFTHIYSQGTFYVWVKIAPAHASSIDFTHYLLRKGVVATPGLGFGRYGEGFIRFALTVDKENLKEALQLI